MEYKDMFVKSSAEGMCRLNDYMKRKCENDDQAYQCTVDIGYLMIWGYLDRIKDLKTKEDNEIISREVLLDACAEGMTRISLYLIKNNIEDEQATDCAVKMGKVMIRGYTDKLKEIKVSEENEKHN